MPLPVKKYQSWSALDYSTFDQNAGSIFHAFKDAGLGDVWLPALAHLCLEVGNFERFTAAWNYGNIKYFGQQTAAIWLVQYNDDDPYDLFMAYARPEDGLNEYIKLIKKARYGINGTESAEEYATKLKSGGYATDPNFIGKVVSNYNTLKAKHPKFWAWGSQTQSSEQPSQEANYLIWLLFLGGFLLTKARK